MFGGIRGLKGLRFRVDRKGISFGPFSLSKGSFTRLNAEEKGSFKARSEKLLQNRFGKGFVLV